MAKAIEVARYLIYLAASQEEPDLLSPMRLQKLLYYVQGWSLALRGEPMFPERIEAWAHGPVVPVVYNGFRSYGDSSIATTNVPPPKNLTHAERDFIDSVWDPYKDYSASSLRAMTHREEPWLDARRGYGPGERCSVEITHDAMRSFFEQQAPLGDEA